MLEQFYGCYVTIWIPDYNSSELVWSAVHACGIFWSYSLKFFNLLMKINIVFARSFRTMLLQEHYFYACINVILHEPVLGWGDSGFLYDLSRSNEITPMDCHFPFAFVC